MKFQLRQGAEIFRNYSLELIKMIFIRTKAFREISQRLAPRHYLDPLFSFEFRAFAFLISITTVSGYNQLIITYSSVITGRFSDKADFDVFSRLELPNLPSTALTRSRGVFLGSFL